MKNLLFSSLLLLFTCAAFGNEQPEIEMEGVLIERPDGSFMKFSIEEHKIVCRFYNAEKEAVDPDVDQVSVRMERRQPRVRMVFAVAIPVEGTKILRAPVYVERPQLFNVFVSLMRDGIKDPVEFYMIEYPGDLTAEEPITIFEEEAAAK